MISVETSPLPPVLLRRLSTLEFSRRFVKFDGKDINPAKDWPWIVEPLNFMDAKRGATFLIKASIQSMKSGLTELFNARQLVINPGRAIWYFPTDKACADFAEEKWNKLLADCAPIRRILFDNPHKCTKLSLDLPFGHFRMCSAGVEMNRNSKSARDISCDEAWEYEAGWLTDIEGRYSSYEGSHRFIIPTSGEDPGSEVNDIWEESDQRTWHNQCQFCHKPFVPEFRSPQHLAEPGGLRFDRTDRVFHDDGRINSMALAATVRLQCPHCREFHTYSPPLQERMNSPLHGADYIPLNLSPKANVHAWNWNAMVNMNWLNLAELQLKAELALSRGDESKLELFIRKRAAKVWDIREYVQIKSNDAAKGDYALQPYRGEVMMELHQKRREFEISAESKTLPPDQWPNFKPPLPPYPTSAFRILTIDVQQDHYWWRVRSWWGDCTSKLIAYGKSVSHAELRDIQHYFGIKDHGGEIVFDSELNQYVMPRGCGVYLDGNYNPAAVRRLAAAYHWCVLRGEDCKEFRHRDGFYRIYDELRVIDAFEGTIHSGDRYVPEIRFSNNAARNRLALMRSIDEPRRLWTYASDVSEEYLRHMNAWVRVEKKNAKTGAVAYEWRQVADRDDLFWCEKADMVIASMAGLIGASEPAAPSQHSTEPARPATSTG